MHNGLNTAIILAGGRGTRLRSVVPDRPKPMATVAGRPFLEHLLRYWAGQGIRRFVLSVGWHHEHIQTHFQGDFHGCAVEYVTEPVPLGTGGALLLCQRRIKLTTPFLLLNGDTYVEAPLNQLHATGLNQAADWVISLFQTTDTSRYLPVELGPENQLCFNRSAEGGVKGVSKWANAGAYWVQPRALEPFLHYESGISLENEVFYTGQQMGQTFYGLKIANPFIDIGIPEDYYRAQTMACFQQGR